MGSNKCFNAKKFFSLHFWMIQTMLEIIKKKVMETEPRELRVPRVEATGTASLKVL